MLKSAKLLEKKSEILLRIGKIHTIVDLAGRRVHAHDLNKFLINSFQFPVQL